MARLSLIAVLLVATLVAIPVGAADSGNGATVYHGRDRPGLPCFAATPGPTLVTLDYTEVHGPETWTLTCHFQYPRGTEPIQAFRFEGVLCFTFAGSTFASKFVATPSGRATLTCHHNGHQPSP